QISDQKNRILNLIKSNPKITRLEISKAMSLHDSSVKRRLEGLISQGLIRRVGSTKAGHWEVL
ncbi:MAG: winged helix-turn-helix transcriptional regulator, partial [Muribaculaceae bacterium]|nr:winged helix-turn-helix transcriptional regulator [Muribaculaceae bacterium]